MSAVPSAAAPSGKPPVRLGDRLLPEHALAARLNAILEI